MQYVSVEFILFLAAVFWGYHLTGLRFRKYYLLAASYLFYITWSVPCAALLFGATAIAYFAARKKAVYGAVFFFVLLLCFFKYLRPALPSDAFLKLAVPVGISYYTFKLISYVVDVYWEKIPAEKDFVSFAAYAVFFPQILSGPIQRADSFIPQMTHPRPVPYEMLVSGTRLLLFGFFKKLVIADRLAIFVDGVYANPGAFNSLVLLCGCYAYVLQLYADFSGLTDIARGSARLLGFESPKNFDLPFFASNIQQYWRRWHMSLTEWLRDYVFNPLRMAFRDYGQAGLALAILLNMALIGLWHGPRMTFLIFGLIHGIYMIVSVLTLKGREGFFKKHPRLKFLRSLWAPFGVFQLVTFASIFFRAETVGQSLAMIQGIAAWDLTTTGSMFFGKKEILIVVLGIILMETVHYLESRNLLQKVLRPMPAALRWGVYYGLTIALLAFGQFTAKDFIYFKF